MAEEQERTKESWNSICVDYNVVVDENCISKLLGISESTSASRNENISDALVFPVADMDITMKFNCNETKIKCENDLDASSKHDALLMKETTGSQTRSKKRTVLPESLLFGVTELVKSRKVELSDTGSIQVSGNKLSNLDGSTINLPYCCTENSLSAVDASVNITQNSVDVDSDHITKIADNLFEMVENKDVPLQNLDVEQEMETEDIVYNLSDLFSGALEQRENYERKLLKRKRKANMSRKNSRNSKEKQDMNDEADDHEEANGEMKDTEIKERTPHPNYFVALQISEPTIQATLQKVQDAMILGNKMLEPALIKLSSLHLTLMVLRIDTDEEMNRCRLALNLAGEQLRARHNVHLALDICGIGNFRGEVVFAKVSGEEQTTQLQYIADVIEECMLNQNIVSPGNRAFKPHLTIMKLSKVKRARKKGVRKIDDNLYEDYIDTYFGSQLVSTIQLCSMCHPKDKDGYYQVVHQVHFTSASFEEISDDTPAEDIALQTSSLTDEDTLRWPNSSLELVSEKEFVEELDRTVYNDIVTIRVKDDVCQTKNSETMALSVDGTKNV